MGPQLYRCGNPRTTRTTTSTITCFNGAATLSLRKQTLSILHSLHSTGLQWGRNFIVAEIHSHAAGRLGADTASMGPQLYRCGNISAHSEPSGPPAGFNGAATLSLRKSLMYISCIYNRFQLQWGRNFIVAEIPPGLAPGGRRRPASMGPQLYRCGNLSTSALGGRCLVSLQWGRNFIVAEMLPTKSEAYSDEVRFNGAATLSLRKF